jgi:drug/metabolite transporter (DMT)-like permease
MDPAALGLTLGSAVLHASWNLVVKSSNDRLVAAWAQVSFGALVFAPFLIASGIPWEAWPSLVASTLVHLVYGLTLVAAYSRGDLSVVYPVARGSAPVLVTIGAVVFLADWPGVIGATAIFLVVAGVLLTGLRGRGHGLPWALAVGALIATYTVIDGAAVRDLDGSFSYAVTLTIFNACAYIPVLVAVRGPRRMFGALRTEWWRHVLGGTASVGAYALVLIAARHASLGLVAAVRETSVVWGALGGWLLLGEAGGRRRFEGAALIALGLMLLAVVR